MKLAKLLDTKAGMVIAIGGVGAIALYFAEKKLRAAAGDVGQAINPINDDNIFHSGVNSVGAKLTGDDNFKLGAWIYDAIHGEG